MKEISFPHLLFLFESLLICMITALIVGRILCLSLGFITALCFFPTFLWRGFALDLSLLFTGYWGWVQAFRLPYWSGFVLFSLFIFSVSLARYGWIWTLNTTRNKVDLICNLMTKTFKKIALRVYLKIKHTRNYSAKQPLRNNFPRLQWLQIEK